MPGIGSQRPLAAASEVQDLGKRLVFSSRGMNFKLAETPAERDMLLLGDILVAKEDHLVRDHRLAGLGYRLVG
jgi:hypothetical protein